MQTVINYPLIKQKARRGTIGTTVGMAALAAGFILSLRLSGNEDLDYSSVMLSYAVLAVALVSLSVGRYHLARWGRQPRADQVLANALDKGLDSRYFLLSYLPTVPVDHLLITPNGLVAIVAKHIAGDIRSVGARWHRKLGLGMLFGTNIDGSLGNPTIEAQRSEATVREYVASALGDRADSIPVESVIVFTDPRARVQVMDPVVPVVPSQDLKNFVRALHPEAKLSNQRLEDLVNLFAPGRTQYVEERPKEQKKAAAKPKAKPQLKVPRKRREEGPTDMRKLGRNRAERRMK